MRKKEKRKCKEQDRGIVDFIMVAHHFFAHSGNGLKKWKTQEIQAILHESPDKWSCRL